MLQAAVREIAEVELGAATAKIARCAGVAAGTLSTYFPNKEERGTVDGILSELETRGALRALPTGFAAATMAATQEERWNS
jgi:AcrR family transcriptional regulator